MIFYLLDTTIIAASTKQKLSPIKMANVNLVDVQSVGHLICWRQQTNTFLRNARFKRWKMQIIC